MNLGFIRRNTTFCIKKKNWSTFCNTAIDSVQQNKTHIFLKIWFSILQERREESE